MREIFQFAGMGINTGRATGFRSCQTHVTNVYYTVYLHVPDAADRVGCNGASQRGNMTVAYANQ